MSTTTSTAALGLALCLAMAASTASGCEDGPFLPVGERGGGGTGAGSAGLGGAGAGCPAGMADCDALPGCETAVHDDPAHCGACDDACSTDGYCKGTSCAEPEELSAQGGTDLTVTADYVIWTDKTQGEIRRAPLAGGATEVLAAGQPAPRNITSDGDNVYWTSLADGKIRKLAANAAPGTLPDELGSGDGPAQTIAIDGDHLFWASNGTVYSRPLAGGPTTPLVSGDAFVSVLALGSAELYFTSPDDCVHRAPKSGGTATVMADAETAPWGITADDSALYWLSTTFPCAVRKRTHDGKLSTLVGTNDSCAFAPLVADATHLYWPQWQSEEIWQARKDDGTPSRLVGHAGHVLAMALDATHLYWISSNHPSVRRIARD